MGFFEKVKDDASDAGYRVCAKTMSKGIKNAILRAMKDKGVDGGRIKAVADVLETEAGEALISILLGYSLTYVPKLNEDPRAERLANEFRIGGMSTAGNFAMEIAFEYFLAPIHTAMEALPEAPKVRVRVPTEEDAEEFENNEEELEKSEKKAMTLKE